MCHGIAKTSSALLLAFRTGHVYKAHAIMGLFFWKSLPNDATENGKFNVIKNGIQVNEPSLGELQCSFRVFVTFCPNVLYEVTY
jgi:hypothetical protein